MIEFDYQQLNGIIHERIRLAILTALIHHGEVTFTFLRDVVGTTDGNLSIQTKKLSENGYIVIKKDFVNSKPTTSLTITEKGVRDYEIYLTRLLKLIKKNFTA